MDNLNKCLEIDPYYADAMAYENLLIRERAYLLDDQKEFEKQIAIANAWIDKAMAAKKIVAEKKAKAAAANGITTEEKTVAHALMCAASRLISTLELTSIRASR